MNKEEAMAAIKTEFMRRYDEWLTDYNNPALSNHDYGWKYGWLRSDKTPTMKDNAKAVITFQKYIYPVRRAEQFEQEIGVNRENVWALARDKWLSECSRKWKTYYFLSQNTAKQIWKEARAN